LMFHFFTATATTWIYTLSLHDALPIYEDADDRQRGDQGDPVIIERAAGQPAHPNQQAEKANQQQGAPGGEASAEQTMVQVASVRSEEHTSELQSRGHLVCRLLLEKKNR